jgi:hypothetical protein
VEERGFVEERYGIASLREHPCSVIIPGVLA